MAEVLFAGHFTLLVPDVLFDEELKQRHSHLLALGLQVQGVEEDGIVEIQELSGVAFLGLKSTTN